MPGAEEGAADFPPPLAALRVGGSLQGARAAKARDSSSGEAVAAPVLLTVPSPCRVHEWQRSGQDRWYLDSPPPGASLHPSVARLSPFGRRPRGRPPADQPAAPWHLVQSRAAGQPAAHSPDDAIGQEGAEGSVGTPKTTSSDSGIAMDRFGDLSVDQVGDLLQASVQDAFKALRDRASEAETLASSADARRQEVEAGWREAQEALHLERTDQELLQQRLALLEEHRQDRDAEMLAKLQRAQLELEAREASVRAAEASLAAREAQLALRERALGEEPGGGEAEDAPAARRPSPSGHGAALYLHLLWFLAALWWLQRQPHQGASTLSPVETFGAAVSRCVAEGLNSKLLQS